MKLDCLSYENKFSALIDKQLDWQNLNALEEHLADCPKCTDNLAEFKTFCHTLSNFLSCDQQYKVVPTDIELWHSLQSNLPNVCELMRCEFSAFIDGELTKSAQEGIGKHLKDCINCFKEFKKLNATNSSIIQGMELAPQVNVDLWSSIKSQLNENCTLIESDLSAFSDQEMPAERQRNVTIHILECCHCRDTVSKFFKLADLLKKDYVPAVLPDMDLMSGIKSKLQVVPFRRKRQPKLIDNHYLAIALASLVGLGLCAGLYIVALVSMPPPALTSEDFLIRTALAKVQAVPETILYEH